MPETLSTEEIEAAVAEHGSIRAAATALGRSESGIRGRLRRAGSSTGASPANADQTTVEVDEDEVVITMPGSTKPAPDEVVGLIRENGLDPAEWVIVSTTLNRWNALGKTPPGHDTNPMRTLRQVKVTLRPRAVLDACFKPAALPPLVDLPTARPFAPTTADLGILTGCWQYPYHDPVFEGLFERFLADVRPAFGIDHGDGMDLPTNSRHPDDPATADPAQASVDAYGLALYRRRQLSPDTAWRVLLGNHDVRFILDALQRAERVAMIRPVQWPDEDQDQLPLLSVQRALRTDELGVEIVAPPFGSAKYATAECVVSPRYIAVHGTRVDSKSAALQTVQDYGCSVSMAHTHRQRLFSVRLQRGPSPAVDATGVEVGCGMEIGGRGSLYKPRPDWANGAWTVTLDDDGEPFFEPIRYRDGVLAWRDYRWRA